MQPLFPMVLKRIFLILIAAMAIITIGLLIPQRFTMPVEGASTADYNSVSFWYYPWGRSGTHKGVDIFSPESTPVRTSTSGWVIYTGSIGMGGNVVLILGPKWRLHYYAHMRHIHTRRFGFVKRGTEIGSVGSTGNAFGKPSHLHYSIFTVVPYPWRIDGSPQGWRKMFYLDPTPLLDDSSS